jgi:hypothetical protein
MKISRLKLVFLLFSFLAFCLGQETLPRETPPAFIVSQNVTSAVAIVTISSPANTEKYINLVGAAISCSAGCYVTQELNSSAATTTVTAPAKLRSQSDSASAVAYTASNIASSGVIAHPYTVQAGVVFGLDLSQTHLTKNAAVRQSFTLRTDNATGTNGITLIWNETVNP